MDFRNIPVACNPAYTWSWNTTVTREGIHQQLDEMYDAGIRVFYVIAMPENFRPENGRTPLSPDYLSEEYIDLLYEAFEYADAKGMVCWLYNEGGWPSGMACGKVREGHPELAIKGIRTEQCVLTAGEPYVVPEKLISAFADDKRVYGGEIFSSDTTITQYIAFSYEGIRSDIADRCTTDRFIELTHEAIARRFGDHMGREVTVMFDDESGMGPWTDGLDKLFLERYGYDIGDFMPWIAPGGVEPETEAQCRAKSDYIMLCGELVKENYFLPMREWLNRRGMLSMGHLNNDSKSYGNVWDLYGNTMSLLRSFDIPGVDVIWSQITRPVNGVSCPEGNQFFPRMASSAARQQGHSLCVSESFAVYGSQLTPDEMRYIIGYQAVRGISMFNFMSLSYDRSGPMCLQFRPNFHVGNPGMDTLDQLNRYTTRLSYILQQAKTDLSTALYWPLRTIAACGEPGKKAIESFEALGNMLEKNGVSFDLIDEDFVRSAAVKDGVLKGEHVSYANVFVPEASFEPADVTEKLNTVGKGIVPDLCSCSCADIVSRRLFFPDGSEGYLLFNGSDGDISGQIQIPSEKTPYLVDLCTGELFRMPHEQADGQCSVHVKFASGEMLLLWLSGESCEVGLQPETEFVCDLTDSLKGFISRRYLIDHLNGPQNVYFNAGEELHAGEWESHFSGEVTYAALLPELPDKELFLELGEVRYFAKIFLNGEKLGDLCLSPYRLPLRAKPGDELKIVVANTIANVCHDAEYFDLRGVRDTGPYHANMRKYEAAAPAGGLIGPVTIRAVI